jgi:hypothetical protein
VLRGRYAPSSRSRTVLVMAPALRAQDMVKGTKKAADKTATITKDISKDGAHGTTKAAKKTGSAVETGAKQTGARRENRCRQDRGCGVVIDANVRCGETVMLEATPHTHTFETANV